MEVFAEYLQFFFSGITVGAIYALIGLGFSLVYNVSTVLNFAQGDFVMLGGMMMIFLTKGLHLPMPFAFLGSVLSVAIVGILMERLAIRPVRGGSPLVMILITIGGSIFFQGTAGVIFGRQYLSLPPLFFEGQTIHFFGAVFDLQVLAIIVFTIIAATVLKLFFDYTLQGKAFRACAENWIAAHLLGINVQRMVTYSFALAGALGALGGVLVTPICLMSNHGGVILGVKGICASTIGGLDNIWGALIGGVVLGLSESFGVGIISSQYKDAIAFFVLLIILFLKPEGLLGSRK
jgi:branched-chain amino acid transport system permease protein